MSSNRAKAAQYRQSDAGRLARKFHNAQPQVRQMKAIKRALRHHTAPPSTIATVGRLPGAPGSGGSH